MKHLAEEERQRLKKFEKFSRKNSLIPLDGKKPIEKGWTQWSHSLRPFDPKDFVKEGKLLNAGLVCGPASDVLVVDADDVRLSKSFLRRRNWQLPDCYEVQSRKNRAHYYFQYPKDEGEYGNRQLPIIGIDIRGVGGQIVIAGSIHPETGRQYEIVSDVDRAPPPEWLCKISREDPPPAWTSPVKVESLHIPTNVKEILTRGTTDTTDVAEIVKTLIMANLSDDQLFYIWYTFPIGKLFLKMKPPKERDAWLQNLIDQGRKERSAVPPPAEPFTHRANWDGSIDSLPIAPETKNLILHGAPIGQRSNAIMRVVDALVGAGLAEEDIFRIFNRYPIGEKYLEKGASKEKWLQTHIEKARLWVTKGGSTDHDKVLAAFAANESGDAELLVEFCRDRYCYDHADNRVYIWDGNVWLPDHIDSLLKQVDLVVETYQKILVAESAKEFKQGSEEGGKSRLLTAQLAKRIRQLHTLRRRQNVIKLGTSGPDSLGITGTEWDTNPWFLGCPNCVIDLKRVTRMRENPKTGKSRELSRVLTRNAKPSDYIKTVIPTEYLGLNQKCPRFEQFLADVFQDDEELIKYLQRLIGYALLGNVSEHIFIILYGPGRNGKSTLVDVLSDVLGHAVAAIPAETLLSQGFYSTGGAPRADLMMMRGKRLVWTSETGKDREFDVEMVKRLTGGDPITARSPYGREMVTFKPTHTLFLLTNNKPHAPSDDYAFWERVHLVSFEVSFVDYPARSFERKRDPNLVNHLKKEAPGILAWIIKGCLRYQGKGLKPPQTVVSATATYREQEDVIGRFVTECCSQGTGLRVKSSRLYDAFKKWASDCGHNDMGAVRFGKEMKKRFKSKVSGGIIYLGLALGK